MQGNPSQIYRSKVQGWCFYCMFFFVGRSPFVLVSPGWVSYSGLPVGLVVWLSCHVSDQLAPLSSVELSVCI